MLRKPLAAHLESNLLFGAGFRFDRLPQKRDRRERSREQKQHPHGAFRFFLRIQQYYKKGRIKKVIITIPILFDY